MDILSTNFKKTNEIWGYIVVFFLNVLILLAKYQIINQLNIFPAFFSAYLN